MQNCPFIKTIHHDSMVLNFEKTVYETLQEQSLNPLDLIQELQQIQWDLSQHLADYNLNSFPNPVEKKVYILRKDRNPLNLLPSSQLVWKCSQEPLWRENLGQQFLRILQLAEEFKIKLTTEEQKLLQICPTYLQLKNFDPQAPFQEILLMQCLGNGQTLGNTSTGFSSQFCQVFQIPSLAEIAEKSQFNLHLKLDPNPHRQLLKIQTVYLYRRLLERGIQILSLNQKNILIETETPEKSQYFLIDPIEDWLPPITPLYNLVTHLICF